jgi:Fur family transcriptional regulator, ferric uptake regulator
MATNQEKITALFKEKGLRLTKARLAFASILTASSEPLSVKIILEKLNAQNVTVNKTTVYREIDRLEKLGILRRIHLGERHQFYELSLSRHHHHLICVECERVEDVDLDEVNLIKEEQKFIQEKKFKVIRHSLEFFGLCRQCQTC